MNIFDVHFHDRGDTPAPDALIAAMAEAGVYGGCVFSQRPIEATPKTGVSFEERLSSVLAWTRGYEGRLFPVLWIHPAEENILERVHEAVDAGIAAFKIICTNFHVYEEHSMALLREIASLGKPVFFHTGILWDGQVSSTYNRPIDFEALLAIPGLRFSLGHCSWPWIDECVALYGKFLNALNKGNSAEMFFDITPGTPEIYRKDLLTKLYTLGYDVGDNVLFGTDCTAGSYRAAWASRWLKVDGKILDELGVSKKNREKLYCDNLMRFLGIGDSAAEKAVPVPDDTHPWSAVEPGVRAVIRKWYDRLGFPAAYAAEFRKALESIPVSDAITLTGYDKSCEDGKRNLLSFLYLCEEAEQRYQELGIPEDVMLATLRDIITYTVEWTNVKGTLYLGQLDWLTRHMTPNIFRLGRLQFATGNASADMPKIGVKKGDPILEIHIPSGDPLTPEACRESLAMAREFFAKHFPDYHYGCFTCNSWLLDESMSDLLPEDSNILAFGNMFCRISSTNGNSLLRYLFRWDTNETNIQHAVPCSTFAERVKRAVMRGRVFHPTYGYIEK